MLVDFQWHGINNKATTGCYLTYNIKINEIFLMLSSNISANNPCGKDYQGWDFSIGIHPYTSGSNFLTQCWFSVESTSCATFLMVAI